MLTKPEELSRVLAKSVPSLFVLSGNEPVYQDEAHQKITRHLQQKTDCTLVRMDPDSAAGWATLQKEANSYSLFASHTLIDASLSGKTLDKESRAILMAFIENPNPRTSILIRAPGIAVKAIQDFANHRNVLVVTCTPPDASGLQRYMMTRLAEARLRAEPPALARIAFCCQNNLSACKQVLEKIILTRPENSTVTEAHVSDHLTDSALFSLYDLGDACLGGNTTKAYHVLQRARERTEEPLLVLWILLQEMRNVLDLHYLLRTASLSAALATLKIWPKRAPLYQKALDRWTVPMLTSLLLEAGRLDRHIKSGTSWPIWENLERITFALCGRMTHESTG